jgi:dTDP-4-amino-4,6-dideoxygalactose transaminase
LPAGSEVLCPNLTAVATPTAILRAGHRPVLVDTDPESLTIDPARAADARSSETAAIVVVHLYGRPAAVEALLALDLPIVEDAAHAHGLKIDGRPAGSIGRVGCFSFYPTKNLGAFGDGGAVVTSDGTLAQRVRDLRGSSRLDELQAAFLRIRLLRLEQDNRRRAEIAAGYDGALGRVSPPGVHHLYVLRSERRDEFRAEFAARGIETAVHYPTTVREQPLFANFRHGDHLAVSTRAAREVLSLPCYPHLTEGERARVVEALTESR